MTQTSEREARNTPIELMRLIVASCAWAGRSPARWGLGGIGTYDEAVAELRREVASSPPVNEPGRANNTTDMWSRVRRKIRYLLLSRDPAAFLTWTPLVSSMTFGLLPLIRAEYLALRHSGRWETHWRDAVRENRAGLPMPSHVYPPTSGTLIHHAYHLHRFETATGRSIVVCTEIVEFGGGYGSMARLVTRLGFRGRYHIHDLPEFSALQQFYLRSVRAEVGEGEIADALFGITCSEVREEASPSVGSQGDAVFLATWSLSETPLGLREEWRPTLARFRYFLIGFQDRFEDIDNRNWFEDFAASRPDLEWCFEAAIHRGEGQRYLFGVPKPTDTAGRWDLGA